MNRPLYSQASSVLSFSLCVLSNCALLQVDYLNKPLEVFNEIHRVLRPGGKAIMSMSNR